VGDLYVLGGTMIEERIEAKLQARYRDLEVDLALDRNNETLVRGIIKEILALPLKLNFQELEMILEALFAMSDEKDFEEVSDGLLD